MKKMILLSLVFVLLMVSTVPAIPVSAAEEYCNDGIVLKGTLRFALAGRVRGVNTAAGTVTMVVLSGNRIAKKCMGKLVVLDTTKDTRFLFSGGAKSSIYNLIWGDPVSANGVVKKDTGLWVARRITEGAILSSK